MVVGERGTDLCGDARGLKERDLHRGLVKDFAHAQDVRPKFFKRGHHFGDLRHDLAGSGLRAAAGKPCDIPKNRTNDFCRRLLLSMRTDNGSQGEKRSKKDTEHPTLVG